MRNMRNIALAAAIVVLTSGSTWGASWRPINTGLPSAVAGAGGLAIDPATPSTLYSWTIGGALFQSTDGAGTWKTISGVAAVYWLVVDPKNSSTIYAGASGRLVKSTNGGASWAGVNTDGGSVNSLVIDPQDSNTLYAVSNGRILKSTNGGSNWNAANTTLPAPENSQPSFLTVDPVTPSTLYAVGGRGDIFKTTNGAGSWVAIKTNPFSGGFAESVLSLAVNPVTPSTIYAGSFAAATAFDAGQGSISRSTDGGQTWNAIRAGIPTDAFVRSLAIDPASPSNVYAAYGVSGSPASSRARMEGKAGP